MTPRHNTPTESSTVTKENHTVTSLRWLFGIPSFISHFLRSEDAHGQAAQGRREAGKGSVHQHVTRRRLTEDTGMRRAMGILSAVSVMAVVAGAFSIATPAASAAEPSPWWHLNTSVRPATISPGGEGVIFAQALNLGNASTSTKEVIEVEGKPYDVGVAATVSLTIPAGLEVVEEDGLPRITFYSFYRVGHTKNLAPFCSVSGQHVTCQTEAITEQYSELYVQKKISEPPYKGLIEANPALKPVFENLFRNELKSQFPPLQPLAPYELLELRVKVKDVSAAAGDPYEAEVSGGGAARAATETRPLSISGEAPKFGAEDYKLRPEAEGGEVDSRAGAHPYQLTADFNLDQNADVSSTTEENYPDPPATARNLHFRLPPGQVAAAASTPTCSGTEFVSVQTGGSENLCPPDSVIGVAVVTINEGNTLKLASFSVPLYNLDPAHGEPARFGFSAAQTPIALDTALRSGSGGDYGVTVTSANTSQFVNFMSSTVTFWGTPGDPSHDISRGWHCLVQGFFAGGHPCVAQNQTSPSAFLTLPTDCAAPFATTAEGDSWPYPGHPSQSFDPFTYSLLDLAGNPQPLTACNQLIFDPQIHSEPTSNAATSPTGLSFDVNFEDEGLLNPEGRAQSQMKKAVVTLPQGFTTNPSVAEGLKACSEAEYEAATVEINSGCNPESKVGEVEVTSPLVKPSQVLHGGLYVAKQHDNPNHNLLTLYLVAREPEIGVVVKQALEVTPDPVTGQLTTTVDNVPQLPFSNFHLSFRQGQRSPLVTPPACGTYTVKALMYPWSNPGAPVERTSSFQITAGPEGQGCPSGGVPPFHPDLHAGTYSNQAGAYTPFYTRITRKDSEQEITHFSIKLPPGVIGKLAGVSSCSDAQIAAAKAREHEGGGTEEEQSPSCPANSEVGHSLVGSGVGNVLAYAPGKLYLAGPYHGSNVSLVSITAAKVGPFDLGTVVVRFALRIDPETAEVFVDGQGSDPIPHIVDGIPVHLRDIQAYVDRPDFTLTPTSCAKKSTASTLLGSGLNFASEADDQPVTVSSFFQVANCSSLGFAPKLGLSLKGGTKRGATPAFKAVLTYPKGSYANIAKSVVTLPHSEFLEQSHIKTICTRVQFKEGKVPGEKCPAASIYGRAEAVTPLLSEPLKGPVYLRSSSHNLPDLVAALHNKQVDFALDGRIDSVKNGRIRNTFETVPDAPVSKFVLEMQGGKKGLLVNSTNLCKAKNHAISEFTGQNGKLYNTNPVLAAKCAKAKKKGKHRGGAHRR
jgi:hypothetical protein